MIQMAGLCPELNLKSTEYCEVGEPSRATRISAKSGCRSPSKSAMANCVEPSATAVRTRREMWRSELRICECPAQRNASRQSAANPGRKSLLARLRGLIDLVYRILPGDWQFAGRKSPDRYRTSR